MAPFPDLDPDHDVETRVAPAEPAGPVAPEDVLRRVKTEGLRRRTWRHRRNAALVGLGIAVVAVPAIVFLPGGDGDGERVDVAAQPGVDASTTVRPRVSTTVPPASVTTAVSAAVDEPAAPSTTMPATTVPPTTLACRNSVDAACGDFYWDPAPAENQPLSAAFVDVPATVTAGEPATFFVSWSDPDATLAYEMFGADDDPLLARACTIERRYGAWTPPDPAPGSGELSYTHTFDTPGEHTVTAVLATGTACDDPYESQATIQLTVTVV